MYTGFTCVRVLLVTAVLCHGARFTTDDVNNGRRVLIFSVTRIRSTLPITDTFPACPGNSDRFSAVNCNYERLRVVGATVRYRRLITRITLLNYRVEYVTMIHYVRLINYRIMRYVLGLVPDGRYLLSVR